MRRYENYLIKLYFNETGKLKGYSFIMHALIETVNQFQLSLYLTLCWNANYHLYFFQLSVLIFPSLYRIESEEFFSFSW